MAGKARIFGDMENLEAILAATKPGAVKSLGRKVTPYDDDVWSRERYQVVVRGNLAKFSQNIALKEFLLATGEKILVEASPLDRIWGIGLAKTAPEADKPSQWKGLNLLGFALMEVRERLRAGEELTTQISETSNGETSHSGERNNHVGGHSGVDSIDNDDGERCATSRKRDRTSQKSRLG
ncbi:hypothetical protein HDU93_003176 [Gonapodya sp. JEL0774]|nr:hypothetical protein HDU93_003176 [Gonapodya sp. JEL0774]